MKYIPPNEVSNLIAELHNCINKANNLIVSINQNYKTQKDKLASDRQNRLNNLNANTNSEIQALQSNLRIELSNLNTWSNYANSVNPRVFKYNQEYKNFCLNPSFANIDHLCINSPDAFQNLQTLKHHSNILINQFIHNKSSHQFPELTQIIKTMLDIVQFESNRLQQSVNLSIANINMQSQTYIQTINQEYKNELSNSEKIYLSAVENINQNISSVFHEISSPSVISSLENIYNIHMNKMLFTGFFISSFKNGNAFHNSSINSSDKPDLDVFASFILRYPINSKSTYDYMLTKFSNTYKEMYTDNILNIPISVFDENSSACLIYTNNFNNVDVHNIINYVIYNFIRINPIGNFNCTVINPLNKKVLGGFIYSDVVPNFMGGAILCDHKSIKDKLKSLADIIQNPFMRTDTSIELLILFDFQSEFDLDSLEYLRILTESGNQHGIYVISVFDTSLPYKKDPSYSNIFKSIFQSCVIINNDDTKEATLSYNGITMVNIKSPFNYTTFKPDYQTYLILHDYLSLKSSSKQNNRFNSSPLSSLLANLLDSDNSLSIEKTMKKLNYLLDQYNNIGVVPSLITMFPKQIAIGVSLYPVAVFNQLTKISFDLYNDFACKSTLFNTSMRKDVSMHLELPLIMDINDSFNILINAVDSDNLDLGLLYAETMVLNILSVMPLGLVSFYAFNESVNNSDIFTQFIDVAPEIVHNKIYTDEAEIDQKLQEIDAYMDSFKSKYINPSANINNINDYNSLNPNNPAPVVFVVWYNYPLNCSDNSFKTFEKIVQEGSLYGVYSIIVYKSNNISYSTTAYDNLHKISSYCTNIIVRDKLLYTIPYDLAITEFTKLSKEQINLFAVDYAKQMLLANSMKNDHLVFPYTTSNLMAFKQESYFKQDIIHIQEIFDNYKNTFCCVPDLKAKFPTNINLGTILYPINMFENSNGFDDIFKTFANADKTHLELPFLFEVGKSFNILLTSSTDTHQKMVDFTHHIIWCFLSSIPVSKVHLCIFDCEQSGTSIAPFLEFRKKALSIFDETIYTTQDKISNKLKQLQNYILEFKLNKLGNRYKDIFEYNNHTPDRTEPIMLLMIYDFPSGLDNNSIELLKNIIQNGSRCGVFVIISYNPDIEYSSYASIDKSLDQLSKLCTNVNFERGSYVLYPYNLTLKINDPISNIDIDAFVNNYVDRIDKLSKQALSFNDILPQDLFSYNSSQLLEIPIGVGDGNSVVNLRIGENSSHHALIAGATGSGKSTLLHTLIMSSMLNYTPDQLHLYLMDFKSGTEFKIYESARLPHIQLLALDALQEFGESILENLVAEMTLRSNLFKSAGKSNLKSYTQSTGEAMPRILVIIDEFQILFNSSANRKVATNCANLVYRIVTEGRSYGIHLVMATQTTNIISELSLKDGTLDQVRIRIGLKCSDRDSRYLFTDKHVDSVSGMMNGSIGTAVMNLDFGDQIPVGLKSAYCDDDTQLEYLNLIDKTFQNVPSNLRIFESSRNVQLLDYLHENNLAISLEQKPTIYMGTPIKVAPPFEIIFTPKSKHNMLICGNNDELNNIVFINYMISASLNNNSIIYCLDDDIDQIDTSCTQIYDVLSKYRPNFKPMDDEGDIIRFINEIYDIYLNRTKHNTDEQIFVFIKDFDMIDLLKSILLNESIDLSDYIDDEDEDNDDNNDNEDNSQNNDFDTSDVDFDDPFGGFDAIFSQPTNTNSGNSNKNNAKNNIPIHEKLVKLIDNGFNKGIVFVISAQELQAIKDCFQQFTNNLIIKFHDKVISNTTFDTTFLLDDLSASTLADNIVYTSVGSNNVFQLKPYIAPTNLELDQFFKEHM